MKRVLIFGAGTTGKREFKKCIESNETVIGFMDNDENKWGNYLYDLEIYKPTVLQLSKLKYDNILIASVYGENEIKVQLLEMGVDEYKIKNLQRDSEIIPFFLNNLKDLYDAKGIMGAVAEAGVFQGETAKIINSVFGERKLYLFDTFEGFPDKDIEAEKQNNYSQANFNQYADTSVTLVMNKMENPENVIIKKGFFPETAEGIEDKFCFVRLDLDLYNPTVTGLEFFHSRMVKGGVVIVHDYFGEAYKGIKKAVSEYLDKHTELRITPIGDRFSIAIIGY